MEISDYYFLTKSILLISLLIKCLLVQRIGHTLVQYRQTDAHQYAIDDDSEKQQSHTYIDYYHMNRLSKRND